MTKPWRHKTNSSNILLVLITLILVEAEWVKGQRSSLGESFSGKGWNSSGYEEEGEGTRFIVGNDRISRYYFRSSSSNGSLTLDNVNRCLENFQLLTCLKMMLLDRINVAVDVLREPEIAKTDVVFLDGLISFKRRDNTTVCSLRPEPETPDKTNVLTLDEEIVDGVFKLFRNRSLRLNLSSKHVIDISPAPCREKSGFVCFGYKFVKEPQKDVSEEVTMSQWEGRKRKRGGKGGGMSMMMMIPQMLMLGFLPFTLASLKAMVMNAVMVNMMALNGAIFMTIRNFVFGPRSGSNVQYVNYGYSKDRQTQKKRPVLIIHSPAAFVKQPNFHQHHHHSKSHEVTHHDFHHHIESKEFNGEDRREDFQDVQDYHQDWGQRNGEQDNNGGYRFQYDDYDSEGLNGAQTREDQTAENMNGVRLEETGNGYANHNAVHSNRRRLFIRPYRRRVNYFS